MVAARVASRVGRRSRMGTGFSLRMMSMGSRLPSKRYGNLPVRAW